MMNYLEACVEANAASKKIKNAEIAVVLHNKLGFMFYRKRDKAIFPEEVSVFKNGIQIYRKKGFSELYGMGKKKK